MRCPIACCYGSTVRIAICMAAIATATLLPRQASALSISGVTDDRAQQSDPRRTHDGTAAERRALDAAIALIREKIRCPVVLIDPELAPDPEAIRRVDAFIVTEDDGRLRQKIYVNRESALFQHAADGDDFSIKVLAAVLVHETAHLAGQKEPQARVAEQRFFSDLIAAGVIPEHEGLRYLTQLRQQSIDPPGHLAR